MALECRTCPTESRSNEVVERIELEDRLYGTRLNARQIEQVADECIEPIRFALDHGGLLTTGPMEKLVGNSFDRRQGRPQIVRDRREQRTSQTLNAPLRFDTFGRRDET